MTEQNKNWLNTEAEELAKQQHTNYEELPSLKLTENVIAEFDIDFSNEFQIWKGEDAKGQPITKKIIPVIVNGTRMNWWLNVKNPAYKEIILAGKSGQKHFKVLQTGRQDKTKYVIVK
jgi:hypothetical protein